VFRESASAIACGTIATAGIANNAVTLAKLATQAANTTLSNATSGAAVPTAFAMPSCSTSASALNWTTNTGFGCNSAISVAIANVTGLGTGVGTALAVNVGSAGAFVTFNGALGTPSSGTLTNATGLPYAGLASAAIASAAQYLAGTASELVQAGTLYQAETTTTFGSTTTFDFATFINTAVTLTANITTQTLSNVTAGKAGTITFIQDGTGSRTTVWNSNFKFAGGTTPTLTTTASAVDVLSYSCRSATFCVATLMKDVK
jgi:hypothetical protein